MGRLHCGEDYLLLSFLLLNLSDYSWRCEKQFRTKNGIIKVWKSPRNTSVVEFRSIFIVLARRVRQLFKLVAWWPLNPSSLATVEKNHFDHHSYIRLLLRNFSNLFMILVECLVNCFNTHLIILSSVFRQLTFFTWRQVNFVNHLKTLTDHPIYGKYVIVWRPLILSSYPTPLAESTWTWTWSNFWRPLIWSIPSHPDRTWTLTIVGMPLISSSSSSISRE